MDELLFLADSLTLNNFEKLEWSPSEEVLDSLEFTFDGTIMAVKTSTIEPYLKEQAVIDIRMGRAHDPILKKVESDDDFYRILAACIPLSEYR